MTDITFKQLKKLAKTDIAQFPQYKLAIMGDCATQHLATALRGYGAHVGLGLSVLDTDYNQIDAQVMDPGSELYEFAPNAVLIQIGLNILFCTNGLAQQAVQNNVAHAQNKAKQQSLQRGSLPGGCVGRFCRNLGIRYYNELRTANDVFRNRRIVGQYRH